MPVGRALLTLPWLRAPIALRRQPAVLLAVAAAAAVLGLTAAAPPLYASSVGAGAVHRLDAQRCPAAVDVTVGSELYSLTSPTFEPELVDIEQVDAEVHGLAARVKGLGAALRRVAVTAGIGRSAADLGSQRMVRIVGQDGAADHVQILSDLGGEGVYLADTTARGLSVTAGAHVLLAEDGGRPPFAVRVRGVFADLSREVPLPVYWCALAPQITSPPFQELPPPPPLLITDAATGLRLATALGSPFTQLSWEFPVDHERLGLDAAHAQARQVEALPQGFQSQLPFVADRAGSIRSVVVAATRPVSVAATLVALALVAGAGGFWLERRRPEVRLLASRGVAPAALGIKAALEVLLPVGLGAAAGCVAAVLAVRALGPAPVLERQAIASAAVRAAVAAVLGLACVAVVAAVGSRGQADRGRVGRRLRWLRWLPVEALVVLAAVVVAVRLAPAGSQAVSGPVVPGIDLGLLAFPLLAIGGGALLAARLVGVVLRLARRRSAGGRWSPAPWLASRRILGAPRLALALAVAAALPAGLIVYASALTASTAATVQAKVGAFVGSRTSVTLLGADAVSLPAGFRPAASIVRRLEGVSSPIGPIDVLGVDPATWGQVAAWDRSYSSTSLATLLSRLRAPGAAVLVGQARRLGATAQLTSAGQVLSVHRVGTASTAPGVRGRGLVIVDAAGLGPAATRATAQAWSRAPLDQLAPALIAAGQMPTLTLTAGEALDASALLPVTWTFDYLQALGALTGLIGVGALLLHLEARQRARALAYALTRRMGLRPGAHLRSLLLELAALLGGGALLGVALGWVSAVVVHGHLDPTPAIPPAPLLLAPWLAFAAIAALLALVVAGGAAFAQRRAGTADPAELLRG